MLLNPVLAPVPLKSRIRSIEGLRGLAAGSVLVYHTWLYGSPGLQLVDLGPLSRFIFPALPIGVTLFFTLSAFLLYRRFAAAIMRAQPRPSLKKYMRSRALRILPAYWVILLVVAIVFHAALVRESRYVLRLGTLVDDAAALLKNVFLVQNYDPDTFYTGIGPAWSLAVEVVFYLTLPLLVLAAGACASRASTRRGRRLAALVPAVILFLLGLSGELVTAFLFSGPAPSWNGDWHSVLDRSFWSQADLFTFGLVVAVLSVDYEDGLLRLPSWWRRAASIGVVVALLLAGSARLAGNGHLSYYTYEMLAALACGILLTIIVLPAGTRARPGASLLESTLLVRIGIISYSLFLWHDPLVRWLRHHGLTMGGEGGFVVNLLLVVTISAALSVITYRYVELPPMRHKGRSAQTPIQVEQAAARDDSWVAAP